MQTRPVTPEDLGQSVIAVPPLARDRDSKFDVSENKKIVSHIENGGVRIMLYGGNANFYHIRPSEYAALLDGLIQVAREDTLIVPAVGPAYGVMMDQVEVLKDFDYPTVMLLPHQGITSYDGVETGVRNFAEAFGKPIVLYIKHDGYIEVDNVKRLVDDGLVSFIKYAVVRDDPADDPYLKSLTEVVDPSIIVSGIGEQPVITHLRDFGLVGFTAGCVCVRPDLSQAMLEACKAGNWDQAEELRKKFIDLEDLRNEINPIRVLHDAVQLAGIAETGAALPFLSNLNESDRARVSAAANSLLNS
ncbi:MAG: dihydrodipicolinate synthase family protein [Verrucomicrobiales bacterium]|nr:dihydrodipicolinate synthase family protein [Verrucomicrobiales bacterium]